MFSPRISSQEIIISNLAYKVLKNDRVKTKYLKNAILKLKKKSNNHCEKQQYKRILVNLAYVRGKLIDKKSAALNIKIEYIDEILSLVSPSMGKDANSKNTIPFHDFFSKIESKLDSSRKFTYRI